MFSKITAATLLCVAVLYLWMTSAIRLDPWSEQDLLNSRTLPYLYGLSLLISALFIAQDKIDKSWKFNANAIKLGSIVSSLLIFLFLLELLGLWICLGLLILSNMIILGQRKPVPTISMSFAFPFICWLTVEKGLGITIPI